MALRAASLFRPLDPRKRARLFARHRRALDALELAQVALLGEVIAGWQLETERVLRQALERRLEDNARTDAPEDDALTRLRDRLLAGLDDQALALELLRRGERIAGGNAETVAAVFGIPVESLGEGIAGLLRNWAGENVDLVKTAQARYLDSVAEEVSATFAAGERWESLAVRIAERFEVARSDAERIAVDQVGKLNGALTTKRHQDLGVQRFTWRTSGDSRVRPEHEERDGKSYAYGDLPDGEMPGRPVRCRCWEEPDIESVFGALEAVA